MKRTVDRKYLSVRDLHDIPGFPGYYITLDGRVFSTTELTHDCHNDGYIRVGVGHRTARKRPGVHQLMCRAFHGGPPFEGAQVRHLDGNKRNNTPENLCWGTIQQNAEDRVRHGTSGRGQTNGRAVLTEEHVREIRRLIAEGSNVDDLAKRFGCSSSAIYYIVRRRNWAWLPDEQP